VPKINYKRSEGGTEEEERRYEAFRKLLISRAVANMQCRGSSTLDESDFLSAYQDLLAARKVDWIRSIVGSLVLVLGGAVISWGASYFPLCKSWYDAWNTGGIPLCIVGAIIAALGAFVQFYPHWNKN
jgi:hypothetical protein